MHQTNLKFSNFAPIGQLAIQYQSVLNTGFMDRQKFKCQYISKNKISGKKVSIFKIATLYRPSILYTVLQCRLYKFLESTLI